MGTLWAPQEFKDLWAKQAQYYQYHTHGTSYAIFSQLWVFKGIMCVIQNLHASTT